ncbi:hypothetical protein OsI_07719 [Oryza sativa Indica Group]|uniref:Uncharacterized protein n=2 Tax=Oryza TaxID=4527 RepID=A0A0E0R7J1_ORYRU|nr:hypothetical protein OsI_07719 [Oryza sativa Indica Group]
MSNGGRGRVAWTGSSGAHTGNGLRGGEVTIGHKASPGHVPAADGMDGDEVGPDVDIATGESLQGSMGYCNNLRGLKGQIRNLTREGDSGKSLD